MHLSSLAKLVALQLTDSRHTLLCWWHRLGLTVELGQLTTVLLILIGGVQAHELVLDQLLMLLMGVGKKGRHHAAWLTETLVICINTGHL